MTCFPLGLLLACTVLLQVVCAHHCESFTCRACFLDPTCRWCTGDGLGYGGACRDPGATCTNVTTDAALCPEVERPDSEIIVSMLQQWGANELVFVINIYVNVHAGDFRERFFFFFFFLQLTKVMPAGPVI